jgi:hypothetical protein
MNKYVVLVGIPAAAIDQWVTTVDEATRKEQTEKLMGEFNAWMTEHEGAIVEKGLPLGKTKRITADGISDTRNDLNWFMVVEAESHDAAAEMFRNHPHLTIPSSYIEVMDANRSGM